jgi:hypothetical protein
MDHSVQTSYTNTKTAQLDPWDHLDLQGLKDQKENLVMLDHQDQWESLVLLVIMVYVALKESMEIMETQDHEENQDQKGHQEKLDYQDKLVSQVFRVPLVSKEKEE